jgi:hypothetical protein
VLLVNGMGSARRVREWHVWSLASQSAVVSPAAVPRSVVVVFFFFWVLTVQVGQDVLTGRDVCAVCAAVVAGVGLDLGDELILVLGGDQLVAPLAGHADGHDVSLGVDECRSTRRDAHRAGWLRARPVAGLVLSFAHGDL